MWSVPRVGRTSDSLAADVSVTFVDSSSVERTNTKLGGAFLPFFFTSETVFFVISWKVSTYVAVVSTSSVAFRG